uniref:Uncharacterized protein n=1 Tax=Opuntia streptacantha TaxID=393608 RepID=A0A7C8Z5B5_OPUST
MSSSPSSVYVQLAGDGGAFFFTAVVVVDDLSELDFVDLVLFLALDLIRSEDLVLDDDLMEFVVELSFLSLDLVRLGGEFDLEELVKSSSSLDVVLMSLVLFLE